MNRFLLDPRVGTRTPQGPVWILLHSRRGCRAPSNSGKPVIFRSLLKPRSRRDSFAFHAVIRFAGLKVLELFDSSIRPLDADPVQVVILAKTEGERKFRLREIAGTTFHHLGPRNAVVFDARTGTDRIPVRLGTDQSKTDAVVPGSLIVPEKIGGPVVGGEWPYT